jgi:hypothetical protein
MRVFARQQMHQQFVEVVAAEQRFSSQQRLPALPLGPDQRLHLAAARPADFERLEGEQDPAQHRSRPTRAAREQATRPWSREKTSMIRLVSR